MSRVRDDDPMWTDLFLGLAFSAFVGEARSTGGWPDSRAVRREAYRLYELGLEKKNVPES